MLGPISFYVNWYSIRRGFILFARVVSLALGASKIDN
jgi:hypothetical protein